MRHVGMGVGMFPDLPRPDGAAAIIAMARIDGVGALPAMSRLEGGVSKSVNSGLEAGGGGGAFFLCLG